VACIATQVSAIPELIDDGDSGLLVPPANPAALAAALETLIRDPARRASIAARGEAVVRTRFSFEDGVDRLAAQLTAGLAAAAPAMRPHAAA
jgi:glycosyltransferase involved in cell wall biosynthesis